MATDPIPRAQTKAGLEKRGPVDIEAVIRDLERQGIVIPAEDPKGQPTPIAPRPGALARFLDSRR